MLFRSNSYSTFPSLTSYNSVSDQYCTAQKTLFNNTNSFSEHGGLAQMGDAFSAGVVSKEWMRAFLCTSKRNEWTPRESPQASVGLMWKKERNIVAASKRERTRKERRERYPYLSVTFNLNLPQAPSPQDTKAYRPFRDCRYGLRTFQDAVPACFRGCALQSGCV